MKQDARDPKPGDTWIAIHKDEIISLVYEGSCIRIHKRNEIQIRAGELLVFIGFVGCECQVFGGPGRKVALYLTPRGIIYEHWLPEEESWESWPEHMEMKAFGEK